MTAEPRPGTLSRARHVAHAALVVTTVAVTIVAGFFHCVRTVDGWQLVRKTHWDFRDQFFDLQRVTSWKVDDHPATIAALLRAGLISMKEDEPASSSEPVPRWCYEASDGDAWCYDDAGTCRAARRAQLARRARPRPTSKCFKERP